MPPSFLFDSQHFIVALGLCAVRTMVCLTIFPALSFKTLTGLMRNGIAFAIALPAVLPTFRFLQETPPDFLLATMLTAKEAGIGLMLGLVLSIPIWVAQSIGSILDMQRSPIQIQSNNSSVDQDASAVGALLLQAVTLILIESGLLIAMVRILVESYGVWPTFNLTPPFEMVHLDLLIKRFAEFCWHIVVYGGPVLIPLILVDFGFALLGVFASNLQISFASSPIKSLVGIFILLVYWPTFSHYVASDFAHILDFVPELLHSVAPPLK